MSAILYNLIIRPLFLFFEFVFLKAYALTGNYGYTIIVLSLTINCLVFPLYRSADAMQKEEREKEEKLSYWVNHIKKTFKGDERYMLLQTYYRQNHFKQTDSLKGTVSLVLQIPFFIAAYRFLSGLEQLNGVSFGILENLGKPDGLLTIAGVSVNVLPILMTAINWVSGAIYTKGMPLKSKIQLYSMALIFLVLLYRSPSGLVFYWTLNNLFSLCKNIFYKLPHPGRILRMMAAVLSPILLGCLVLFGRDLSKLKQLFVLGICGLLLFPTLYVVFYRKHRFRKGSGAFTADLGREIRFLYVLGVLYLTVLTGLLIPSAVVVSSPGDFVDITEYHTPLQYVVGTLNVTAGFFLVWFTVFYMLTNKEKRHWFTCSVWVMAAAATVNYMFFARNLGNMSAKLVYDNLPVFSFGQKIWNLCVLFVVVLAAGAVFLKRRSLVSVVYLALIFGAGILSVQHISGTNRQLAPVRDALSVEEPMAEIPLSRTGKNVIVFMLDRSIGPYVPYLMKEKPELQEKFSGFTYYKNTVSMGTSTNAGSGALFGGYEYSAYEMNRRSSELLVDKHNEALRVMPFLFAENGYQVTVCDPPYAGYSWWGDLSIYNDYPSIRAYHTKGRYNAAGKTESIEETQRHFIGYSIMKVMPLFLQHSFYDSGAYNNSKITPDYTEKFMNSYSVLENLPSITRIIDDAKGTFFMIDNETSHEPCKLQLPEYIPAKVCENGDYELQNKDRFTLEGVTLKMDTDWQLYHYYVDMAAFLKLGEWFDYLRENNVYNNTKIILVSDHGYGLGQIDRLYTEDGFDLECFLPVYMVKDFDAEGFTVSVEFMTNADTPALAMKDVIESPMNPFTGHPIDMSVKEDRQVVVFHTSHWGINENNGTSFMAAEDNRWFHIQDDVYNTENWTPASAPSAD